MSSSNRVWVGGSITLEMFDGSVCFVRCLKDPAQSPGDTDWSCAIVIRDGVATPKILRGTRGPTITEIRALTKYFKSLGYSGGWHRYKNGKKPKEIKA